MNNPKKKLIVHWAPDGRAICNRRVFTVNAQPSRSATTCRRCLKAPEFNALSVQRNPDYK